MSRARPALAVLLLTVATVAVGLAAGGAVTAPVQPADDPVVGTSENTSRVLLLTRADAAQFDTATPTVTNALEAGHANLDTSFQRHRIEARLDAADTPEARGEILENATDDVARRVAQLREQERDARAEFANGQLTARQYLVTLGTLHAEAETLETYLGRPSSEGTLYTYARPGGGTRSRISRLRAQLATLQGPVREQLAGVVVGDRPATRVHVSVGNGVMLSTLRGSQYVRESFRPDNLDEDVTSQVPPTRDIVTSHYPWVWNNSGGPSTTLLEGYAFQWSADHNQGRVVAFVDMTTEQVYVERQWKSLLQVDAPYEARSSADNTTLLVSRTYAGGPVQIRVENASGAPVDATVALNGTGVGRTGEDGQLWTLSPASEYPVSVTHDGTSLDVNVTARPAP
ncbi:DUF7096 domain-containing protein [Halobacterium litoreum]|uniref:Uncharacterized protein n=1 Tax=Halobacterium litoreum TaxID=2039234 RepID=A0ABD5NEN0_9EURY|nr:hypothetical protein [Halobacterium litoreum]UHH13531.1 hypothetical protein LT972_00710 [Halobacterium litoreum]